MATKNLSYILMTVGAILAIIGVIKVIGTVPPFAAISVVVGGALGFVGYRLNLKG